jgi:hypothetical protein
MFKLERIKISIYVIFITFMIPLRSDDVELNIIDTEDI